MARLVIATLTTVFKQALTEWHLLKEYFGAVVGRASARQSTIEQQFCRAEARPTVSCHSKVSAIQVLTLCLLAMPLVALGAGFTATVDRTQLSINESLTLTLSYSGQTMDSPDIAALEKDFDVLSQQKNSQLAFGFGGDSSSTDWILALGPKRAGTLNIPAFTFLGESTDAIAITVNDAKPQASSDEPIFIETEIDKAQSYVQAQVLLTLRLHTAVNLSSVDISELQIPGATTLKIHDTQYKKTISGRDYQVLEVVYGIFPEAPGTLTIPAVTVAGVVPMNNDPFGGSGIFGPRGQAIRLHSEEKSIQVQPAPEQSKGHPWLPAQGLSLSQDWSKAPDQLKVGEPVTRTITITAQGLAGAQIPPLTIAESPDFKHYPDQPEISESLSANGVLGVRTESVALVPTRPGKITLPPLAVTWWDTANNRLQTTQLEAVTLEVLPGDEAEASAEASAAVDANGQDASDSTIEPVLSSRWLKASLLLNALLLTALAALLLWPKPRRNPRGATPSQPLGAEGEIEAYNRFHATPDADLIKLRSHLLAWARLFWPEQRIATLADVVNLCNDDQLANLFTRMDKTLYGSQRDDALKAGDIKSAVKAIRKRRIKGTEKPPTLKPLYPRQ